MVMKAKSKLLLPRLLIVFLLLVTSTSLSVPGLGNFMPMVDVAFIYYWSLFVPPVVNLWFLLFLGILRDILSGVPIGLNIVVYIALGFFIKSQVDRIPSDKFNSVWLFMGIISVFVVLFQWLILSLANGNLLGIKDAIMQILLTIATYPLWHWIFALVHETLS
ncbi:rod shape-determining protein MreD, partial [Rickettsiales bacterium]|nr:rod shape-determining protein MreD [Rickettsiales bacterium]